MSCSVIAGFVPESLWIVSLLFFPFLGLRSWNYNKALRTRCGIRGFWVHFSFGSCAGDCVQQDLGSASVVRLLHFSRTFAGNYGCALVAREAVINEQNH
ncbi:hypothetical protein V6N13_044628 [Hibiscus sabdariffa]|uniref:Secreted protein n=1 Tax=Hibiscus sabdariffa TaxID=183260 RepID=A0ABR2RIV0_9ROSI